MARLRLLPGDLLVARIGATTGKTYIVRDCLEAVFASYLIRIRATNAIVPDLLYYYTLSESYWRQIDAGEGGRLKLGVNIPILNNLRLLLPPLAEQRHIADILATVDSKLAAEDQRKGALEALFTSLLEQLMTRKLRVSADGAEAGAGAAG